MQNSRELSTFPISPVHKAKLFAAGFLVVEDLKDIKPSELSKETGLGLEESLDIIKLVLGENEKATTPAVSALDILHIENTSPNIITFSEQIDSMLGGGVPLRKITEFCGAPGIGKTQMCMQLAVDVQIPELFGGMEGDAVYIDTEGSFIIERLVDIAKATVKHCQNIASGSHDSGMMEVLNKFTMEAVLSGIHYFRCHDYVELLSTVHLLPKFLKQNQNVKVVIVDSVAFHFRHDFEDLSLRTRLLTSMAQSFIQLATDLGLSVVLTNQMTTKIQHGENSRLIPALGESWGHASTIRVILYWEGNQRWAWLYKSPSQKEAVVPYQITIDGIRDMVDATSTSEDDEAPAKRQRIS